MLKTDPQPDNSNFREYLMLRGDCTEMQTAVHLLSMDGWVASWSAVVADVCAVNMFRLKRKAHGEP